MRRPTSVSTLEEFGRERLSQNFFMRDFLYSEISQIEGIPNIPDNPEIAIEAGRHLCVEILEPIQSVFGRVCVRSAYRSSAVNSKGAENNNQYKCASNERNYAHHIWDIPDSEGNIGAMACIVVPSALTYLSQTKKWQSLAWWIHDNLSGYSSAFFFPKLYAFNIGWHQSPKKRIDSYVKPKGCLTKPGMPNHEGSHKSEWVGLINAIEI